MNPFEQTGEKFKLDVFLKARDLCIETMDNIISQIEVGMRGEDIKKIVEESFRKVGVDKYWHPTKIRIGSDTIKSFREASDPTLECQQGETCFLDLGPIIKDHEADYGKTFVIGSSDTSKLIEASHTVFKQAAEKWKWSRLSGLDLFEYANELAKSEGYILNPSMAGHRLGDFPHKLFSFEKLFELNTVPSKNLWVLEIHLIDPKNNRGAFFEDILM